MIFAKRRKDKNAKTIKYPDLASSSAPVLHSPQVSVPEPPTKVSQSNSSQSSN